MIWNRVYLLYYSSVFSLFLYSDKTTSLLRLAKCFILHSYAALAIISLILPLTVFAITGSEKCRNETFLFCLENNQDFNTFRIFFCGCIQVVEVVKKWWIGCIGTFIIKGWCHSEQANIPLEFGSQEWFCPGFGEAKKKHVD